MLPLSAPVVKVTCGCTCSSANTDAPLLRAAGDVGDGLHCVPRFVTMGRGHPPTDDARRRASATTRRRAPDATDDQNQIHYSNDTVLPYTT